MMATSSSSTIDPVIDDARTASSLHQLPAHRSSVHTQSTGASPESTYTMSSTAGAESGSAHLLDYPMSSRDRARIDRDLQVKGSTRTNSGGGGKQHEQQIAALIAQEQRDADEETNGHDRNSSTPDDIREIGIDGMSTLHDSSNTDHELQRPVHMMSTNYSEPLFPSYSGPSSNISSASSSRPSSPHHAAHSHHRDQHDHRDHHGDAVHSHPRPVLQHSLDIEDEQTFHVRFPIRSALVALFLLTVGLTCLSLGIYHFATGKDSSFAFFLIGAILIIPGSYQCWNIYQAWRHDVADSRYSQFAAFEGH